MNTHILWVSAALSVALAGELHAQIKVEGQVVDSRTGEPIIGASVAAKKEKSGVISDLDGNFSLDVKQVPTTLNVQFVGYRSQTIDVYDNEEPIVVELTEVTSRLEEVVVVGYGTQKRTQLTGSVASLKAEVFETLSAPTLDVALSGSVAGLNVTAGSGQPGAASSLRIRGGNSVNASNEPLYVIDGFIYYKSASDAKTGLGAIESSLNPLSTINPADIESVEVLKDVSATAIYGSRGANGVIIVTSKKGTRGKATINYRYSAGFDQVNKKLDLMNASQWAQFQKDYYFNKGGYSDSQIAALGEGTDWQDAMLRNAFRQSHEVSINGGTDKSRYAFSAAYTDQNGVVINTGFSRYNFHLNADWTLAEGLTFGTSTTYGQSKQDGLTSGEEVAFNSSPFSAGITNSIVYGLLTPQTVPVYRPDGSYNYSNPFEYAYFAIGNKTANAVSDLENSSAQTINDYLLSNVWVQYVWKDFTFKATVGLNSEQVTQNYFSPSYTSLGLATEGIGGIGNKRGVTWQQEYSVLWSRQLGAAHYLDAMAGFTRQNTRTNYNSVLANHFTNETLGFNNLADASNYYPPKSGQSEASLNSVIARVNYTLRDRYNATATFRADNSSRFAKSHRWGYFPSLGLSWNVDKESFLSSSQVVSNLKLRASFGIVGNQEIDDYEYALSYQASQYDGSSSYAKTNSANEDLKWETTTSYNIGFDLGLWNSRLELDGDFYYKRTSDLLLEVPLGFSTGVSSQLQNVGNVVNRGVEFSADYHILERKKLSWTLSASIAHNHNEITDMGSTNNVILGSSNETILRRGEALGSFYGLIFDGIVQQGEDPARLPTIAGSRPQAGDVKYVDVDGNGRINGDDRMVLGSIQPALTVGLSSSLKWRNLDASLAFSGSYGGELYNGLRRRLELTGDSYNLLSSVLESWTPQNASNSVPRGNYTRTLSYIDSRYVENASYLKLRNLTVGYTFDLKPRVPLQARLFFTGSNLLTISSYTGYDPEVASGSDLGAYPSARSFVFGVDLTF